MSCRILGPSLSSGNAAVASIVDLSIVNSTVQQARALATEANNTLEMVQSFANQLMAENISGQASVLLNTTRSQFQETLLLNNTVAGKNS